MKIKERLRNYFKTRSVFRISTDLLFYLLILSLILPFSRKYVATGVNKVIMLRPGVLKEENRVQLDASDYAWSMGKPGGEVATLADYKGELIFLSFWATWCPPCRAEMPNIQRLYEAYGDQMRFLLVSQEEWSTMNAYMQKAGYTLPTLRMIQNPPQKLASSAIPTTFLISPEGTILIKKTGAARWDGKFMQQYLDSWLE